MLGRKSIVKDYVVRTATESYIIKVQADKCLRICDVILGTKVKQEITDKMGKKKTIKKFFPIRRMPEIMSKFQGRQINSETTHECLTNAFNRVFNLD